MKTILLTAALAAVTGSAFAQQPTSELLIDPDLTVGSGASIAATIGAAAAAGEDAKVPNRLFAEEPGMLPRAANIGYRIARHFLFDAPQEHLLLVVNHEIFGHGARLRERFDGPIGYDVEIPPPYGHGAGATYYVLNRQPTPYESLAVSAGGLESTTVAASMVADRAFASRRISHRDGLRYLTFELDTLRYIASTESHEKSGNDVTDFLRTYNAIGASGAGRAGRASGAGASTLSAPPALPALTITALRSQALMSLANPMLAVAAFSVGRYWWSGETSAAVPAIHLGAIRYLPLAVYRLTPYGTEWGVVNMLGGSAKATAAKATAGTAPARSADIELRIGRSMATKPWGVSVRQRNLAVFGGWGIDAAVDAWKQPPVASSAAALGFSDVGTGTLDTGGAVFNVGPNFSRPAFGARASARISRAVTPIWFNTAPATLIVEVGGKSAGYVPGEPLRSGLVARIGMGVPIP